MNEKNNQSFVVAYRQKMAQTVEDIILGKPTPTAAQKSTVSVT
jgi:hypothetical protein